MSAICVCRVFFRIYFDDDPSLCEDLGQPTACHQATRLAHEERGNIAVVGSAGSWISAHLSHWHSVLCNSDARLEGRSRLSAPLYGRLYGAVRPCKRAP